MTAPSEIHVWVCPSGKHLALARSGEQGTDPTGVCSMPDGMPLCSGREGGACSDRRMTRRAYRLDSDGSPCRICGLPEERHGLCPGHREEWIQWASRRPTVQNDRGFDEWIESRRRDIYGEDA